MKVAKKVYKAAKYTKKARSAHKKLKAAKKASKKPKVTKTKKKKTNKQRTSRKKKKENKVTSKENKCNGPNCFVAGTKISTEKGYVSIERLKPGDYVWAEDPATNTKALKKVNKIFVREKDSIVRLSINGEIIETTDEHPFFVDGKGFVGAADLQTGDEVRLQSGDTAAVDSVEEIQLDEPVKVYNFEVEGFHTYYVGDQQVLVHNTCGVKVAAYNELKKDKDIPGQAHHLNQNAAFKKVIPKGKGLSVKLEGNAFFNVDSPHYNAHETMEAFWDQYRKGGALHGKQPTIGEYNRAVYDSLVNAGMSKSDSAYAVRRAYQQQMDFDLTNSTAVPKIPRKIYQKRRK